MSHHEPVLVLGEPDQTEADQRRGGHLEPTPLGLEHVLPAGLRIGHGAEVSERPSTVTRSATTATARPERRKRYPERRFACRSIRDWAADPKRPPLTARSISKVSWTV